MADERHDVAVDVLAGSAAASRQAGDQREQAVELVVGDQQATDAHRAEGSPRPGDIPESLTGGEGA